ASTATVTIKIAMTARRTRGCTSSPRTLLKDVREGFRVKQQALAARPDPHPRTGQGRDLVLEPDGLVDGIVPEPHLAATQIADERGLSSDKGVRHAVVDRRIIQAPSRKGVGDRPLNAVKVLPFEVVPGRTRHHPALSRIDGDAPGRVGRPL